MHDWFEVIWKSNVEDTRKLALETCMCVSWVCLACLKVLRVIVLSETNVECTWHVKVFIYIGNSQVRLPKGNAKSPQGGPKGCRDTALAVSIDEAKGQIISPPMPRRWWGVDGHLAWWMLNAVIKLHTQTTACSMVRRWTYWRHLCPSMVPATAAMHAVLIKGWMRNLLHVLTWPYMV